MREDRGLNILQYEKKAQLINSSFYFQEMRKGQPSFKGVCDLEACKLKNWQVTHRQDDVDRFLHPLAISQLIKLMFY